jgi:hypothetical protein
MCLQWLVAVLDGLLCEASWPVFTAPPTTALDGDDVGELCWTEDTHNAVDEVVKTWRSQSVVVLSKHFCLCKCCFPLIKIVLFLSGSLT